jgi:hypothetical protein
MPEHKSPDMASPPAWHVPVSVADIPEAGQHFDLVADAPVRAAVARIAGLRDLPRLEANFDLKRRASGGLHVTGLVSASVGQTCVVTLEPIANEIEEGVDLLFEPKLDAAESAVDETSDDEEKRTPRDIKWDDPEPLIGGAIDLGALATEFLMLGLDPYPRKPGAVFTPPPEEEPDPGPFAALSKLTKGRDGH